RRRQAVLGRARPHRRRSDVEPVGRSVRARGASATAIDLIAGAGWADRARAVAGGSRGQARALRNVSVMIGARIAALLGLWLGLFPGLARAAGPLSPADRASAQTMYGALARDPFAEEPLRVLVQLYERGSGIGSLIEDCKARATAVPTSVSAQVLLG